MLKTTSKRRLTLSSQTIRQLDSKELNQVAGGISLNCTRVGVSLCVLGCGLWEITDTGRAEIRRPTIAKRITRLADETEAEQKRRNEERE